MNKRFLVTILVLTVAFVAVFPGTVAAAETYYVATTGSDTTGDGSAGNPWATIQYAINQSSSGDTVTVEEGTYYEAVNINKSLTLVSAGYSSNTIIDAQGADFGVLINGNGNHHIN